jgi:aminoglycoside phosphotransferase (APT) family kinase protein
VSLPPRHARTLGEIAQRLGLDGRRVEALAGGSRNHLYRLGQPPRAVAVRLAGEGDAALGVFRDSELLAQRAAAGVGLAPQVLLVDAAAGVLVGEWVPGRPWEREEAASPAGLRRIAQWLRSLHALAPPAGLRRVDFLESLQHYANLLAHGGAAGTSLEAASRWRAELGEPARPALCHHDLHHANVLDTGTGLVVVDWEYAGLGDPIMDLAGFASYQRLVADGETMLVDAYGASPSVNGARLAVARRLFDAVACGWSAVHASCGAIKKQS